MRTRRALAAPMAVAVGAIAVCATVAWADPTTPGGVIPPCPTYSMFGILCPGCGSSRMLYSLLHSDLPAALHYNALGLVALLVLALVFGLWTVNRLRDTPMLRWTRYRWTPHLVLTLTVVWFVVRNIPVAPFTALRI